MQPIALELDIQLTDSRLFDHLGLALLHSPMDTTCVTDSEVFYPVFERQIPRLNYLNNMML